MSFLQTLFRRSANGDTHPGNTSAADAAEASGDDHEVEQAARNYLLFVLLPLWIVPGFLDYWFHRRTDIEHTSGTHESILHSLQMTTVGIPTLIGMLFEINAGTIALMIGAVAAHEATTIWDVAYAVDRREVPPNEQHCHSFLEVLPFTALSYMICLHPQESLGLIGLSEEAPRFGLERKRRPLPTAYVAGILSAIALFIGIPYADELVRCMRVDPQPLPQSEAD